MDDAAKDTLKQWHNANFFPHARFSAPWRYASAFRTGGFQDAMNLPVGEIPHKKTRRLIHGFLINISTLTQKYPKKIIFVT
ncbi:hypothetical protein [Parasphaerochaeta coccoides]|uniref:hypothetical protein n=1 Tax=Parasphaerochaeta coccoides TaxID=273376 RepID=UPI00059D3B92|nr:hypothetical protein [Parasphaerochaeta coccoides]